MGVGQGGEGGPPPGRRERRRLCQVGQGCAWWGLGSQPQGIITALSWGAASLAHPPALGQGALPFPVTGQVAMAASWEAQPPRILWGDQPSRAPLAMSLLFWEFPESGFPLGLGLLLGFQL